MRASLFPVLLLLLLLALGAGLPQPATAAMTVNLDVAKARVPPPAVGPVSPSYVSMMVEWGRIRDVFSVNPVPTYRENSFTQDMLNTNTLKVRAPARGRHPLKSAPQ